MTLRIVPMLIICLSAIWAAAPAKCADPVPPPKYPFHDAPPYTLKRHPALSVTLGPLMVKFERTNLKEVQKVVGSGEIHAMGDAAENTLWLCYGSHDKEDYWQIWLLSGGEMDKPEGRIYGIVAKILPRSESKPSCPVLPTRFSSVVLNNGIWLNATHADVLKKLGEPSLRKDSWLLYSCERRFRNDPRAKAWRGNDWIEIGELSLRFQSGKVIELWATISESGE
jgi:hypothetical protein